MLKLLLVILPTRMFRAEVILYIPRQALLYVTRQIIFHGVVIAVVSYFDFRVQ